LVEKGKQQTRDRCEQGGWILSSNRRLIGDLTYLLSGGDGGYLGSRSGFGWLGLGGVAVVGLKEEWRSEGGSERQVLSRDNVLVSKRMRMKPHKK